MVPNWKRRWSLLMDTAMHRITVGTSAPLGLQSGKKLVIKYPLNAEEPSKDNGILAARPELISARKDLVRGHQERQKTTTNHCSPQAQKLYDWKGGLPREEGRDVMRFYWFSKITQIADSKTLLCMM